MTLHRPAALLLALSLGAALAATAFAAGNYKGTARSISLTAGQAKYTALTASGPATKPPADKRRGYRSGWQASYLKGSVAKPVTAYALVYVYATPADAKRAYTNSCPGCSKDVKLQQVTMKYQYTQKAPANVVDISTCRNVYVATVVSGKLTAAQLAQNAAALAGRVFAKATAGGMSPCAK